MDRLFQNLCEPTEPVSNSVAEAQHSTQRTLSKLSCQNETIQRVKEQQKLKLKATLVSYLQSYSELKQGINLVLVMAFLR